MDKVRRFRDRRDADRRVDVIAVASRATNTEVIERLDRGGAQALQH